MTLTLPVGSVLFIQDANNAWQKITEHNRAGVSIDVNRIEKNQRMSNGTLRKIWIADKKSVSTSWNMLPSYSTMTVDGGWGAEDIKSFYLSSKGQGTFNVRIAYNATRTEDFLATFSACSFNIVKRNVKANIADTAQAFWDVSISLEQV